MANTSGIYSERYNGQFASTLRTFMEHHPDTGIRTTQKQLADFLQVRPQTVSLYAIGESLPNCEQLMKIAEYFNVTADFMMTGRRTENKPVRDMLGLSENTVQNMKLVKEGYFEDAPYMLPLLDYVLGDKDFYLALERAAESSMKRTQVGAETEYAEFYEWKAGQALQEYFMNALRQNVQSIYNQRRGDE